MMRAGVFEPRLDTTKLGFTVSISTESLAHGEVELIPRLPMIPVFALKFVVEANPETNRSVVVALLESSTPIVEEDEVIACRVVEPVARMESVLLNVWRAVQLFALPRLRPMVRAV